MSRGIWLAFSGFTVLLLVLPRAFYPTLHMDESLYVGAAVRMLGGDPFLTDYWFDKFFLTAALIVPSILVAGPNALGFHLAGMAAGIAATVLFIGLWHASLLPHHLGVVGNRTLLLYDEPGQGAKILRVVPGLAEIFATRFSSRWIFDVEILERLAQRFGSLDDKAVEVPLREWHDIGGSRLRPGDFLRGALELAQLWLRYQRPKSHRRS